MESDTPMRHNREMDPPSPARRVLLIEAGRTTGLSETDFDTRSNRLEFQPAIEWLCARSQLTYSEDVSTARRDLAEATADGRPPELIVILQTRVDQFRPALIDSLRQIAPLARWIVVTGSWVEGETRNGTPIPNALRIPWHSFASTMEREWDARSAVWNQAATLSVDERLQLQLARTAPLMQVTIAVAGPQRTVNYLRDCLCSRGIRIQPLGQRADVAESAIKADFIIWDDAADGRGGRIGLERLIQNHPQTPIIALKTFPRTQDMRHERADVFVLPKPYLLGDLLVQVAQWLTKRDSSATSGRIVA